MIHIRVRDFRGLSDLDQPVPGVLLLAGPNGAGKSSACVALAAAATGELLPFEGLTKGTADLLVRDGGTAAEAALMTEDGAAVASWPAVERSVRGDWRDVSAVAAGLADPVRFSAKERAAWLITLLRAEPSHEALATALGAAGVPESEIAAVWAETDRHGWDGAANRAKERGTRAKGAWERVTGERYGVTKAAGWRPKGWRSELEQATQEGLDLAAEAAEAEIETARRNALVGETRRQEAQGAIDRATTAEGELPNAERALAAAEAAETAAADALGALGVPVRGVWSCPCCGERVALIGDGLARAPEQTADAAAIAQAEEAARQARATRLQAGARIERLRGAIEAAARARATLAALPSVPDPAAANRLLEAGATIFDAARMKRAATEAAALHEQIGQTIEIVRVLSPGGLRQATLTARLAEWNATLEAEAAVAGWTPAEIGPDMTVGYGGRPVSLCSAGEQYRARVLLQIAAAVQENAALMILDGADILDRAGRNGLFKLLRHAALPAVVGMTLMRREDMPDLGSLGWGAAVWLEDRQGVTR